MSSSGSGRVAVFLRVHAPPSISFLVPHLLRSDPIPSSCSSRSLPFVSRSDLASIMLPIRSAPSYSDPILLHSSDPIPLSTPTLSNGLPSCQAPSSGESPSSSDSLGQFPSPIRPLFSDPNRFGTCTLLQLSSELSTPSDDVFEQFNYSNQS